MRNPSKSGPNGPGTPAGPLGLGELLTGNSVLGALAKAASSRLALADAVRQQLPADLAAAVSACNLRPDGTLVVTAVSSEWASRLRYEGDGILAGCRPLWPAAARIRFRVGTDL